MGDALRGPLGAAGLQVEQRIGAAERNGSGERSAGIGIEQADFEGIVRAACLVLQCNAAERETKAA